MSTHRIWKYQFLPVDALTEITMPKDALVLDIQAQNDKITLWAIIRPDAEMETRYFACIMTGQPFAHNAYAHVYHGTVQLAGGSLVVHVFEVPRSMRKAHTHRAIESLAKTLRKED